MGKKKAAAKKVATEAGAEAAAEPKGSKAQAIRDALKVRRDKSPSAISAYLETQGYTVKPQEVSNIKSQLKAKRKRKKLALKGEAAPKPKKAATGARDMISMAALEAAQKLAKELGGLEKAKQAINSLSRLLN